MGNWESPDIVLAGLSTCPSPAGLSPPCQPVPQLLCSSRDRGCCEGSGLHSSQPCTPTRRHYVCTRQRELLREGSLFLSRGAVRDGAARQSSSLSVRSLCIKHSHHLHCLMPLPQLCPDMPINSPNCYFSCSQTCPLQLGCLLSLW